jgi:enamidase
MLDLFPDPEPSDRRKVVIENIGLLLSGRLEEPILDADTIVAVAGTIVEYRQGVTL